MSSENVTVGLDGWLFLTGGSNDPIRFYLHPDEFTLDSKIKWSDLLIQRYEYCAARGIAYAHIAPPEKLTIYPEFFPQPLPFFDASPSYSLPASFVAHPRRDTLSLAYLDILPALLDAKVAEQQLYWKTDTHWTFEGAYAAYLALCERFGAHPDLSIAQRGYNHGDMVLDLGRKLNPPIFETYKTQHIEKKARRIHANSLVEYKEAHGYEADAGLHGGSAVIFKNESPDADPRRVVLFGDSYAEYRPILLTGLLAETFSELHFIWSARVDWTYVDQIRPHIVITELAERFMNYVPADDLSLETFADDRIAAHKAELAMRA